MTLQKGGELTEYPRYGGAGRDGNMLATRDWGMGKPGDRVIVWWGQCLVLSCPQLLCLSRGGVGLNLLAILAHPYSQELQLGPSTHPVQVTLLWLFLDPCVPWQFCSCSLTIVIMSLMWLVKCSKSSEKKYILFVLSLKNLIPWTEGQHIWIIFLSYKGRDDLRNKKILPHLYSKRNPLY